MSKKHRSVENAPGSEGAPVSPWYGSSGTATLLAVGLVVLATLRIVATYPVFNHTVDEPAHLACGIQWYDQGTYTLEPHHPPLARIAMALGPFLMGRRATGQADMYKEGATILYGDGHYERNLTLARLGIMPFFWIACLVLYGGTRAWLGEVVAVVAVFLYSFVPTVLAHAGLATNDMALSAMLAASFVTGLMWIQRPDTRRSIWFGACTGLAVIAKFSIFLFLPVCVAAALLGYLVAFRPSGRFVAGVARRAVVPLLLAIGVALVVIWAGYRFSVGKVDFAAITLPFPQLFNGVRAVMAHNSAGHASYLLGERSKFRVVVLLSRCVLREDPTGISRTAVYRNWRFPDVGQPHTARLLADPDIFPEHFSGFAFQSDQYRP